MIFVKYNKYGVLETLDLQDETIFKGNNKINQVFVYFDDLYLKNTYYLTYAALVNSNDYEGNLTDLATTRTTYNYDGVDYDGFTFYLFSNLTAKAGTLNLSVRLVDRNNEEILVSGMLSLIVQETAISTYSSVNITLTQYEAILTALDDLSQQIETPELKTINDETLFGLGNISLPTFNYVDQRIDTLELTLNEEIEILKATNEELETKVENHEKRIKQLELASEGNILNTETSSGKAYELTVEEGILPYATIDKIGGMTYKSDNLSPQATTMPLSTGYFNTSQGAFGYVESGKTYTFSAVYTSSVNTSKAIGLRAMSNSDGTGTNLGTLTTPTLISGQRVSITFTSSYTGYVGLNGSSFDASDTITDITLNIGTNDLGYTEYFIGLRDSAVSQIISSGGNLLVFDDVPETTVNGLTYSASNGIIYLNGTATAKTLLAFTLINLIGSGTYSYSNLGSGVNNSDSRLIMYTSGGAYANDLLNNATETLDLTTEAGIIKFSISAGTYTNATIKPIVVSGSTIPTTFKPYRGVITTKAIPTEIQELDGYGLGVDDEYYNYIDFENKKFVKRVQKIVLDGSDDEIFYMMSADNGNGIANFNITLSSLGLSQYIANGTIDWYVANREEQLTIQSETTTEGVYLNQNTLFIRVKSTTANTIEGLKTYLASNPVEVVYAITTPIETDISDYLSDEFIEVEEGGTLTFDNQYQNEVNYTWTYQQKI